jgi:putative FmdB family regulatory protein
MPIYEYEPLDGQCKICGGRFELRRPASREPLEACPLCRKPVRKLVSAANTPRKTGAALLSQARDAGFQVVERRDQDVFEKR